MRILIAEDDYASRLFLQKFLMNYAECDTAVDGFEALDAFLAALKSNNPYDLLCLDVMMPKFDGLKVLKAIRDIETQRKTNPGKRVRVILTTALDKSLINHHSVENLYETYLSKPIDTEKLMSIIQTLGLE
jgi:two-component system chemotaxis response regulator CheY